MSCGTCKHFHQTTEDHGYCLYKIPAWLILALKDEEANLMPVRYAPCNCYEEKVVPIEIVLKQMANEHPALYMQFVTEQMMRNYT